MQRRLLCTLAALPAVLGLSALAAAAHAQTPEANWPSKPIRWIVPFPPGGAMDAIARTLGEKAARTLGQPFVIENRPGAGGNIGADFVAKSPADGYTLMITSIGMATNKPLYRKLSYDPIKDFAPVGVLAVVPNILVTNATQPQIKSVTDVVAAAKAAPGKLTYASAGNGTSIHLAGEVFTSLAGVDMLHIPYKGSGPAVSDLLGGQVNYMFDSITSARPHIQSGKLRALAVTTAKRSTSMPDVPTMEEAGIKGYEVSPWFAAFVPAGTPPAIVKKLNQTLVAAMKQPDVIERFQAIGAEVVGSTPEEAARHLQTESQRWTRLINERGIHMD
ncbi:MULTISPECIES: tripartite tricarboxylate transporter substrate binding protein [Comamonas]|uniref:tripartite tricarboxylate transporter substrate binding protein n=1 Tax=Comamonas TaxID=283 RepID=UPI0015FB5DFC|nr:MULTISPECIES: tripartite tricarboxylate transporter substrate binding protein [Comamonas]UUC93898.1 tripartite tricarboxylate transporter substrate binding protein [Comamonas sp. C11]WEE77948.1 tripartite tricarboxylate transporter substrate binding protein [Comamonas testosteroni]